jgi:hypothetical protein
MRLRQIFTCILFIIAIVFTSFSLETQFVIIDSLSGKAEVQRAGQKDWVLIKKDTKLFNNDILRIHDKSHAKLLWKNGSIVYVNSNSQILINLHQDTINNMVSQYTTVFFGAVYFVIKKTLPKAITRRFSTKIYTPTAILAIRGTSFSVDVEKKNGTTRVGVVNGLVLVNNILKSNSLFLSAGYKTEIGLNADPILPVPILKQDIESLKKWVPSKIISEEMSTQVAQARKDHIIITGKLDDKIVILPFSNISTYRGKWLIQEKISKFLAENIKKTYQIMCVTPSSVDPDGDPVNIGIRNKSRYVIVGEIVRFEIIQRAEMTASADRYREFSVANICIAIQLIDAENKKLIFKDDICGEILAKNIEKNRWPHVRKLPFDINNEEFAASIIGKALNQALELTTTQLFRYLGGNIKENK